MAEFEPILSAKIFSTKKGETQKNLDSLRFPLACSVKYDGIRLVEYQGDMHTRSLKVIRNYHARAVLKQLIDRSAELGVTGLDGEIVVGDVLDINAMQNTTSGIQTYAGTPEFTFLLFDSWAWPDQPFAYRNDRLKELYAEIWEEFPWLTLVHQEVIHNLQDFLAFENSVVLTGAEGIMGRRLDAPYKFGRSSMREQYLMALKRFVDGEALVLEMLPEYQNTNPVETNELGRTKRSGHQENLVAKDRMGTLICKSPDFDLPFRIGGGRGWTHAFREEVWQNPDKYLLQPTKYTYQEIGVKERPRLPKGGGFRSWEDMTPERAALLRSMAEGYVPTGEGKSASADQYE